MNHTLPDQNSNGYVTLSDFCPEDRQAIEQALRNGGIPHEMEAYKVPEISWMYGVFRVYVPGERLEEAKNICCQIKFGSVF